MTTASSRLAMLVLLLAVQAVSATLLVEHYPAFIYPHFARSKGEAGQIDVLTPEFIVEFENGERLEARLDQVFPEVPTNLAAVMAKEGLLDSSKRQREIVGRLQPGYKRSLVQLRGRLRRHREKVDSSNRELQSWFHQNLHTTFAPLEPRRLTINWWNRIYTDSASPQQLSQHIVDSFSCDLKPRPR